MKFSLKDIIDLDFFLELDEDPDTLDRAPARDREIYRQIEQAKDPRIRLTDDSSLALAWLSHRRQQFSGSLPGDIYQKLLGWTARGLGTAGFLAGLATVWSFLAYHGSRPVNVTLFVSFFVLLQALLALAAGAVVVRGRRSGLGRYPFFHTLVFEFFMGRLKILLEKAGNLSWGKPVKQTLAASGLARFRSKTYQQLLFWPIVWVCSLTAFCFSLGCLAGTLFRVMVTDLAFGWQSTLFTSGVQVHSLASILALPWSWLMPDGVALPTLAQVEGSRIILKQGISGLATQDLASWWPFLCMGILVYGVLPRLAIMTGAVRAGKKALESFDLGRPRYRRLLIRMRSPRFGMDIRATGGSRARTRPAPPHPEPIIKAPEKTVSPAPDAQDLKTHAVESLAVELKTVEPQPIDEPHPLEPLEPRPVDLQPVTPQVDAAPAEDSGVSEDTGAAGRTPALVLASARSFPDTALDTVAQALDKQLGLGVSDVLRITCDMEADEPVLAGTAPAGNGAVVVLQEVWQPPIRGLLYYFTQLKNEVYPDHDLWIFLCQTPGQEQMAVDTHDMDFKVWQTAVSRLKNPGIILERWMP